MGPGAAERGDQFCQARKLECLQTYGAGVDVPTAISRGLNGFFAARRKLIFEGLTTGKAAGTTLRLE